jgi:hypothetical protein
MDQRIIKALNDLKCGDTHSDTHSALTKCFGAAAAAGDHELAYLFSTIAYKYSSTETDSRAYNHAYACLMTNRHDEATEKCLKILERNEEYYQARCMLLSLVDNDELVQRFWKDDEYGDLYKLNAMDHPLHYKHNSERYDSAMGGGSPEKYMESGRMCFYLRKVLANMFCTNQETTHPSYCSKLWTLNDLHKDLKSARIDWFFRKQVPKTTLSNLSRWLTLVCPELVEEHVSGVNSGTVGVVFGSTERDQEEELAEKVVQFVKKGARVYKWGSMYREIVGEVVYMPENLQQSLEIIKNDNLETLVFPELTETPEAFILGHMRLAPRQITVDGSVVLNTHKIDKIVNKTCEPRRKSVKWFGKHDLPVVNIHQLDCKIKPPCIVLHDDPRAARILRSSGMYFEQCQSLADKYEIKRHT